MKGMACDSWCWWQKLMIDGCGVLQVRPEFCCNKVVTLRAMPPSAATACVWHCLFSSFFRQSHKKSYDSEDYDRCVYVRLPRLEQSTVWALTVR